VLVVVFVVMVAGCGESADPGTATPSTSDRSVVGDVPNEVRIITLGDSQTAGAWLDEPAVDSWPAQLNEAMCPESVCVENLAQGGQTLVTDVPGGPLPLLVTLDEQLSSVDVATIAVVLIGQVDLVSSEDVDAIAGGYRELADRLRESGLDVVVFVTLFPFDPGAYPNPEWLPTLDERRQALNASLRAMSMPPDVLVVDVEESLTADASSWLRPEFGVHDGNHPSPAAARVIALAVAGSLG